MENKMLGRVKWYKANKGYGYIIAGDGETYFFEIINCKDKDYVFKTDDKVKFVPNYNDIDIATKVEKVDE